MTPTQKRKNSGTKKSLKLKEIAALVEGELVGDSDVTIEGVAGIKEAQAGDITFLSNTKYLSYLDATHASAVIASRDVVHKFKPLVRVANPSSAFTKVITFFLSSQSPKASGIHATAVIAKGASLGSGVFIGPHVVIEEGTVIGDRSSIDANTYVGANCIIGEEVKIYPNVTVREQTQIGDRVIVHSGTVIGSDGFGYEAIDGVHEKIPQIGSVLIEDDVEIGANVCIDRGRFQKTRIGKGTKIDNLVQIAHNVVIGPHCLLISQCGISGSTEIGKNVVIAGQAGITGHVTLGDDSIIGAQAGVTKSVPPRSVVLGAPAKPVAEQKRLFALISKLPELFKDVYEIKKKFEGK